MTTAEMPCYDTLPRVAALETCGRCGAAAVQDTLSADRLCVYCAGEDYLASFGLPPAPRRDLRSTVPAKAGGDPR